METFELLTFVGGLLIGMGTLLFQSCVPIPFDMKLQENNND
jgi:hypothetical protein